MLEFILAIVLGCSAGIVTGLTPGLHTNTIAIIALGSVPMLSRVFAPFDIVIFLISMTVVHSFLDFIPTIFFGAPEPATALGVLPGHKMLLEGRGYDALKLTVAGGIGTFIIGLALLPLLFLILNKYYTQLNVVVAPILIIFSILFIAREKHPKKIIWSLIIFGLAGTLGLLVLDSLTINQPLFPMLSGLFGISTLVLSCFHQSKLRPQIIRPGLNLFKKKQLKNYLKAAFSASITSTLPAIGAAQAAIISQGFTKFKDKEDFLVIIGGINTVAALFTLSVFIFIGKARTGVIVAVKEISELTISNYFSLIGVCAISLIIAVVLTLKIGRFFAVRVSNLNYRKISIAIIAFISVLVAIFSGLLGLFVLLVSTLIGLLAPLSGVRRIHLMACLIIPVVLYFI